MSQNSFIPPRPESHPTIYAYCDSNPRYDGQLMVGHPVRVPDECIAAVDFECAGIVTYKYTHGL